MNLASLTVSENASIRAFLTRHSDRLRGRLLDYGSGRQPYRDLVAEAGAGYNPYDRTDHPCSITPADIGDDQPLNSKWDSILCTQVVQYVPDVPELMAGFARALEPGGALVLTYPTCWPEVNAEDLHRFTRTGMERLLDDAGFQVVAHELRGSFDLDGFQLAFGYGVVAT